MFNSHLPKLGACMVGGQSVCGEYVSETRRMLRVPWKNCSIHGQGVLSGLLENFLMEFVTCVVNPCPCKSPMCHFPSLFPHPSHAACYSVLGMGPGRNEPLWQHPTQLGKPCAHSHALTYHCGRNQRPRWSLLALSSATLGKV